MRFWLSHRSFVSLFLALVVLVACAPASSMSPEARPGGAGLAHPAAQITPTPSANSLGGALSEAALPASTEQQLHSVYLPPRDRIALARRLLGVTFVPTPPASPAREWQVGDTATFWVDNMDSDEKFQVEATLRYSTAHVYMWVQTGQNVDEEALRRSAETFENHIYPTVRAAFGSEWSPGIDGDSHLYILHATGMGYSIAAYFFSENEHPPEAVSTSNAHEMFFVNLDTMAADIGTPYYDGVLAHEFQHMIHWAIDANEDTWLNEGLAELAGLLTDFDNAGFAASFLQQPGTQLNTWPETASRLPYYGGAFLFATYFYERFGPDATRQLVANPANGMDSVDDTLRQINATDPLTGQPVTAEDLFADWLVANVLHDTSLADGRYGYALTDPTLPTASAETISVYPTTQSLSIPQYSGQYLRLTHVGPQRIRLDFQGSGTARLVPTDAHSGRYMWYSNRGDNSDATLTRAFDLSGVSTATLEFYTWYHIEHLWDYAYLMVSTDDGETWAILSTDRTTTDNPHNNAYGPGYTGSSGSDLLGPAGWVQQQVDLTPFVGGRVLVRFEMITDEATNQPGMVIDDVGIPEIGYFDDFERGPGGWASEGWLYIDNVLTQRWIVQLIARGADGTQVTRLLGPDDGASGSWEFDVGGPVSEAILVISPLAPVTTEAAQYTLALSRVER